MRISSINLKNFKRFTDLYICDIPKTARLVVIVGPNGCGKSSLFDGMLHWYKKNAGFPINDDRAYYQKLVSDEFDWNRVVKITFHDNEAPKKGSLYVRTAYRNDPDFNVDQINRPTDPSQGIRVSRAIDNDTAVSDNYRRLVYATMSGVYDESNDDKSVKTLREELVGSIRESMKRVFGDLILSNVSDPLGTGTFFFEKGAATRYHYKNLSGGEKSAFDLLLDLHIKKEFFPNAIYCIDELETHLHTRVQGKLVKEMVRILPAECQMWITTHSLGVLRAAQEMMEESPESVCLIDFDGVNPDHPNRITPSNLGRITWEKLLSIALDDLSNKIAPSLVIICEGSSIGNRRRDFDAEIYNRILGSQNPGVLFVSGGASNQVSAVGSTVRDAFSRILPTSRFISLMDRDERSDSEVSEIEATGNLVLPKRNLESFLFADDVMNALLIQHNRPALMEKVREIKNHALERSIARGNAADDWKSAAGEIYTELKKLLLLQQAGSNTDHFMRDTLAPLIKPPMETYKALKESIIDRAQSSNRN